MNQNRIPEENINAQPGNNALQGNAGYQPVNGAPDANYGYQPVNDAPYANYGYQPVSPVSAPAGAKKKSKRGLIIGISVGAAAVIIAAVVFLFTFLSPDSRFTRAMENKDYTSAERIISREKLTASKANDLNYLTLADHYLDNYNDKTDDYQTALRKLIDLKSADIFEEETTDKIEEREKTLIDAHLGSIYEMYSAGEIDYDTAAKQISESDPYGEATAKSLVEEYAAKTDEKRDELYSDAIAMITGGKTAPEDIIAALEPFGDYRDAKTVIAVFGQIKDGKGVEAAKLLANTSEDGSDTEKMPTDLFSAIKSYIMNSCFDSGSSNKDYAKKIDNRLGESYARLLLGDDSRQINNMFDGESSHALNLSKKLDLSWFSGCKGGTGKILYIPRYRSDTSWSDADQYYYYHLEDKKDIPLSKMPESLEDVEYVIVYDEGSIPYAEYSTGGGDTVKVYQRTVQVTVRQYPTGKVIYDSGVLKGATPADTITVFSGTKHAYGKKPDLTAVKEKVKKAVGLK